MTIPTFDKLMKPTLELLSDDKPRTVSEINQHLIHYLSISEDDLKIMLPSSSQTMFRNRASWARTYLSKANLIYSPQRSVFRITEEGMIWNREHLSDFTVQDLKKIDEFLDFYYAKSSSSSNGNRKTKTDNSFSSPLNETPEELIDKSYNTINESLGRKLLEQIMLQPPEFFEQLVVSLLNKMGYGTGPDDSLITGKSGDEGIDGIIYQDRLGFDRIYIQAKRWGPKYSISRPEIQKFVGALSGQGAQKGLYISTASFTSEAVQFSQKQHIARIVLIDGLKLAQLMIEYNHGVFVEKEIQIKRLDNDFFMESD